MIGYVNKRAAFSQFTTQRKNKRCGQKSFHLMSRVISLFSMQTFTVKVANNHLTPADIRTSILQGTELSNEDILVEEI